MRFILVLISFLVVLICSAFAQEPEEEAFLRLQKSGRPMMQAFMNPFPYHNPTFTLREDVGRRKFSGF